jgi:predicted nucleic acid-binding protein
MARLILTDASPLIGLARVDGIPWLSALFGVVWMPDEVHREVLSDPERPDARAIAAALEAGWLKIGNLTPTTPALAELGEGEAACIRIALARNEPALLLMDDRAGRAMAIDYGLRVAGTAAVIGMAKSQGLLIDSARAVLERLHRSDFRIAAPVIETILRQIGEL